MAIVDERYAEALVRVAYRNRKIDIYAEQLEETINEFSKTPNLQVFLENPEIKLKYKLEIIDDIYSNRKTYDQAFVNFMKVIVENNRYRNMFYILKEYIKLAKEYYNLLFVTIESAKELDKEEKEGIIERLRKEFGVENIKAEVIVNEELIGGIKIITGNVVIDRSLKKQLLEMQKTLQQSQKE